MQNTAGVPILFTTGVSGPHVSSTDRLEVSLG